MCKDNSGTWQFIKGKNKTKNCKNTTSKNCSKFIDNDWIDIGNIDGCKLQEWFGLDLPLILQSTVSGKKNLKSQCKRKIIQWKFVSCKNFVVQSNPEINNVHNVSLLILSGTDVFDDDDDDWWWWYY